MIESLNFNNIEGFVTIDRYTNGKNTYHSEQHNLIVTNAREIVRDLVLGTRARNNEGVITQIQAPRPAFLVLGDGNQLAGEINIGQPVVEDKVLVNPTLWVPVGATDEYPNNEVEAVDFNGRKAIKYTFVITEKQGNTASGFFCELGLALDKTQYPDAYLFNRITKSQAILKTEQDSLTIQLLLAF